MKILECCQNVKRGNISDSDDKMYLYLGGEAAGLGEHVEVPACEGEGDGLLHLDGDGLLLLVHVGGLGQLDVAHADVAGSGELDALLGARDHHRLAELGEILQ